jgi:hypothetical protein
MVDKSVEKCDKVQYCVANMLYSIGRAPRRVDIRVDNFPNRVAGRGIVLMNTPPFHYHFTIILTFP